MRRLSSAVLSLALLTSGLAAPSARADGDPGSDVLAYQSLFLAADASVSIPEQVRLDRLLRAAARAGFPVRVAIIAAPADLGAIGGLWRRPRAYARFLGVELSLAYSGRLLVVMPNGFGFNWPGHPSSAAYRALSRIAIGPGGDGLAAAAQAAVQSLAAADRVKLRPATASAGQMTGVPRAVRSGRRPLSGSSLDALVAIVAVAAAVAGGLALAARRALRERATTRQRVRRLRATARRRLRATARRRPRPAVALGTGVTLVGGAAIVALIAIGPPTGAQGVALSTNPSLDPGTPLFRLAPGFTLTDQFGQPVSLRQFRGKVVLLAFNDSECTTICPLTTTAMLDAKAMLGPASARLQLLGVDANPKATSLDDVLSYSELHGMLGAWRFLTGSLPDLQRVWRAYGVQAAIQSGQIAHTPALFVIDPQGRERRLFMTQQSYAAIGQLGQLLAQAASALLPGHPPVASHLSYAEIGGVAPDRPATLPGAAGGTVTLGSGHPRVLVFFATWDRQITGLAGGLEALGRYSRLAGRLRLPPLEAVDEGSVEPPGALQRFLRRLPRPLPYPVAVDRDGRVADGYQVQGLPWLMVVSASGRIAWYEPVATAGWPGTRALIARVRQALSRAGSPAPGAVPAQLAGSPPALAALHRQAGRLLGPGPQLAARIRALRGYPIVINAWASWCSACRSEFGLFASASARYGRQVAFLGLDTGGDSAGDARSFLAQHPVSYPSYQIATSDIIQIVPQGLAGLPTTIFINRRGKLAFVHTGQYDSQGTLDGDIQAYALGR